MHFSLCLYLMSAVIKISFGRPGTSNLLGYGNTGARLSPLFGDDEISNFDDAIEDGGVDVRNNKLGYAFPGSQLTGTERVGGSYGADGLIRFGGGSIQISQPIGSYGVGVTRGGFDNGGGIRSDEGYGFGLRRTEGGKISDNGIYRNALARLEGGLTTDRLGYSSGLTRFGNGANSATIRARGLNYGGASTRVGGVGSRVSYGTGLTRFGDISNPVLPRVGGVSIGDNYGGVGVTRFGTNTGNQNNIGTYDSAINGFGFTRFGTGVNGAGSYRVGSTEFGDIDNGNVGNWGEITRSGGVLNKGYESGLNRRLSSGIDGSYGSSSTRLDKGFINGGASYGVGSLARSAGSGIVNTVEDYGRGETRVGIGLLNNGVSYDNGVARFGGNNNNVLTRMSYHSPSSLIRSSDAYGSGVLRMTSATQPGIISGSRSSEISGFSGYNSGIGDSDSSIRLGNAIMRSPLPISRSASYLPQQNPFLSNTRSLNVDYNSGIRSSLAGFNTAVNSQTGRANNNKILSRSVLPTNGYTSNSADLVNKDNSVIDSSTNDNGLMRFGLTSSRNYNINTPLSNSNSEIQEHGLENSNALYRSTSLLSNIRQGVDGSSFMTNGIENGYSPNGQDLFIPGSSINYRTQGLIDNNNIGAISEKLNYNKGTVAVDLNNGDSDIFNYKADDSYNNGLNENEKNSQSSSNAVTQGQLTNSGTYSSNDISLSQLPLS